MIGLGWDMVLSKMCQGSELLGIGGVAPQGPEHSRALRSALEHCVPEYLGALGSAQNPLEPLTPNPKQF